MAFGRRLGLFAVGLVLCAHAGLALAVGADLPPLAVDAINVERVGELAAGTAINVNVYGSPRAIAVVRIEGARRLLDLHETEPGVYEGTYLIGPSDAIRADSQVTAALQRGGEVARSTLDEPLLLGRNALPWAPEPTAVARARDRSGDAGSSLAGPPFEIARALPARPFAGVPVPLRTLEGVAPENATVIAAVPAPARPACADCATVESVRAVEATRGHGALGALGGGIAGAIIANEIDHAHRVLSVLGAIGGALIGRQVELAATRPTIYEAQLRLRDGSLRTQRFDRPPPFAAGDTVHLGSGRVEATPAPF